jgi:hypothetical protein
VQAAAKGADQAADNIVSLTRSAGDTGTALSDVSACAQSLSREGELLKLEIHKLMHMVRA